MIVLLLLFGALASCMPAKPSPSASSAPGGPHGSASQSTPYQIVMVFPSSSIPADLHVVQNEINRYIRDKIGATVEIRPIDWADWENKTNLMQLSNERIDLMFTASWLYFGDQVYKGRLLPLDDLIDRYGQGIRSVLDPLYIESGKVNGHIYGIVTNKEFASTKGIVMRKDLVEKYHIDLSTIKTLEDLEPVYRTIKENEPGITPLQVKFDRSPLTTLLGYGLFDMLDYRGGPGVLDRAAGNLQVINMYETPTYLHYAELMHKWFEAGYINRDGATTRQTEQEVVKAGKAFSYSESLKPGIETQESRSSGMPMVTVELTAPYTTTGDTTSAMFAIPKTSENPEKAMMFLDLLYTDKYLLNLLNWGIEGQHYVKLSEQTIDLPPGVSASSNRYHLNQPWMFGNQFLSYTWVDENPNLQEEIVAFNRKAEKSAALGFIFNPNDVRREVEACNLVIQDFAGVLNAGQSDPQSVIASLLNALKLAGADKVN
jgi:putative aldouronate transport system substrate-binding protein